MACLPTEGISSTNELIRLWYIYTIEYYMAFKNNAVLGWAWWLMDIILALGDAQVGISLEPRSLRPAWATK